MEPRIINKEESDQYDAFVKKIKNCHDEMFKDSGPEQRIMSLYIGAVNMIGNIYQSQSAKDKRVMLRGFISDVRNNFRKKNTLE